MRVPAVDQEYANGLSLWQHKVIRRYAQRLLHARTDIVALARAKAEIRALVERDFNRKSTRGRKRHARFMEDHACATVPIGAFPRQGELGGPETHLAGRPMQGRHVATARNLQPDAEARARRRRHADFPCVAPRS